MIVSMILALDPNNLIGKGDHIPWNVTEDMMWFVEKTKHKSIVMGRKTFEGIGRALPGRLSLMIGSTPSSIEGVTQCASFFAAKDLAAKAGYNELVICGGVMLYKEALLMNWVDKIYLTRLQETFEGDVHLDDPLLETLSGGIRKELIADQWVIEEERMTSRAVMRTFVKIKTP